MLTTHGATSVAAVNEDVGRRIRERRSRLGMPVTALAERAGVDRGRLAAIEAGDARNPRPATIGAIERALDELEHELGMDADLPPGTRHIGDPEDDLVEITVEGNFGVRFVVKGPVRDIDEIRDAAQKLMRSMSRSGEGEMPENPTDL